MNAKEYLKNHWIPHKIWTHYSSHHHRRCFQICAQLLKGDTFIDVGCALGHSTHEMSLLKEGSWSGLEFLEEAVIRARELFPAFTFYCAKDFNFLSVCGEFDGVLCSEVLEHVESEKVERLVKGLLAITKKVLVLTTPCVKIDDPGHLRVHTEATLADLFKGTDFTIHRADPTFFIQVEL